MCIIMGINPLSFVIVILFLNLSFVTLTLASPNCFQLLINITTFFYRSEFPVLIAHFFHTALCSLDFLEKPFYQEI